MCMIKDQLVRSDDDDDNKNQDTVLRYYFQRTCLSVIILRFSLLSSLPFSYCKVKY